MKCCSKGFDTHPDIINHGCSIFYYPNETGSGKPCKFFTMCQNGMKRAVKEEPWAIKKHNEYLKGIKTDGMD